MTATRTWQVQQMKTHRFLKVDFNSIKKSDKFVRLNKKYNSVTK